MEPPKIHDDEEEEFVDPLNMKNDKMDPLQTEVNSSRPMLPQFTFDLEGLDHHPAIIISGKRHSGKNIIMNELILHLDKKFRYKRMFAFSQTATFAKSFPFMREEDIFDTMDNLKKIVEIRRSTLSKDNILIILDDVQGMTETDTRGKTKMFKNAQSLETLFTLARHYNISLIVSVQRAKSMMSKFQRSNADLTILFSPKSHDEMYNIKCEYLGLCKSKQEQNDLFDSVFSKQFCCLVVESWRSGVTSMDQYCKWCVAPYPVNKFKAKYLRTIKKREKEVAKQKKEEQEKKYRVYNIDAIHHFRLKKDDQYENIIGEETETH